jgi:hypothetical protein
MENKYRDLLFKYFDPNDNDDMDHDDLWRAFRKMYNEDVEKENAQEESND